MPGVVSTTVGYAGGNTDNPTYREVCSGGTGHAEVVQVEYDPALIAYEELLETFFRIHNPTIAASYCGGQYRSAVFYHNLEQAQAAGSLIEKLAKIAPRSITTEVSAAPTFWRAEDYHQNYYKKSGSARSCRI